MKQRHLKPVQSAATLIAILLACSPAYADKDKDSHGNGHGKHDRQEQHQRDDDREHRHDRHDGGHEDGNQHYFTDHHRVIVHQYYVDEFSHGRCPPGLAKKRNGCMPPGLAKRWVVGQPLPREIVYYPLPPAVIINLGPPPAGAQYVRVANDILLIAAGTGMVLDALADLSGM